MRLFYTSLFYLFIPLILLRLFMRGFKAPDYRRRWNERFAFYNQIHPRDVIWFHAVSVGEAESVFPLIRLILRTNPQANVLVTSTTPTGSNRVRTVLGDSVSHVYLPYDLPAVVERFFLHFKPAMAVIMETEIWPNLFLGCGKHSIPLFIINARVSARSVKRYSKIPALVQQSMASVKGIAAQTQDDADRFLVLGADKAVVKVTGNIKFDLDLPPTVFQRGEALRRDVFPGRLVWIVASTHRGEDEIFLQAYRILKKNFSSLILVIVPRHPERFEEVRKLSENEGLNVIVRSRKQACNEETDIYLADTMGELKMLYAGSDIAFVGGSLVPVGGHNVLEPAAIGLPVVFGPFMTNFKEIASGLLAANAAIQVRDQDDLVNTMQTLLLDGSYREQLGKSGQSFISRNRGAVYRVVEMLDLNPESRK